MLVLTRLIGENILIGNNIKISILGIKGNQVRIGFEAPKEIIILREEVYYRSRSEKPIQINSYSNSEENYNRSY